MSAWRVDAIELPFGDAPASWWIDSAGSVHDRPIDDAEQLPGEFVLSGLADAHGHPAVGVGPSGPIALDRDAALANLLEWARSGVTLVRDTGSPAGISLELDRAPGMPVLHAAGRFLAPAGRYFPDLLCTPVPEADLISCALAEVGKGATWVKVIADFPDLAGGGPPAATYPLSAIADLTAAVHQAGARIAAHSTSPAVSELVAAGVDSIEHGTALDEATIREMARRGTAWTPTLCAAFAALDTDLPPEARRAFEELRERLAGLLTLAVSLGVPVLAGSDGVGSIPREVAHFMQLGLQPAEALAAASVWPRDFLGAAATSDVVTYHHDPREDADELLRPAAVVAGGTRLR